MKTSKKVLSVLLSVLMIVLTMSCLSVGFTVSAAGGTDGGITWDYNTGTKTLTISPAGSGANSGVMNDYSGYNTYELPPWSGESAKIETIIINSGVKNIGSYAFMNCSKLTSVTIPGSVTRIGSWAFNGCEMLTGITIPNGVETIGAGAFSGCIRLQSFTVAEENQKYASDENGCLYNKSKTALLRCPAGNSRTAFTVPGTVTSIDANAFADCASLRNITIPDSVTSIGASAFAGCASLRNITIPDSVTSIGTYAFFECTNLESVSIPNNFTEIGEGWFCYCENLLSVTIPDGVTSIGDDAFSRCKSLESVTIPDGVTSIGARAFEFCDMLTEIRIPASVKTIGLEAFNEIAQTSRPGGDLLTRDVDVYITDIEAWCAIDFETDEYGTYKSNPLRGGKGYSALYTFVGTSRLWLPNGKLVEIVELPDSASKIGAGAFESYSVTVVKTGNGVESIGKKAFYRNMNLRSVTLGTNVKSIGSEAFAECYRLQVINYPGSEAEWNAITIAENAFYSCPEYMTINFNYNGISSGTDGNINWTYNSFTKELTVSGTGPIPDYQGNILGPSRDGSDLGQASPWYAYAPEIKTVTILEGVTSIGDCAFYGCKSLESVTIPEGVTSIGAGGFALCDALQTVTIPKSMESIAASAFIMQYEPTQITVSYAGSAEQWNAIQFGESVFLRLNFEYLDFDPYKVAVVLPGFVNLPFGSDGLKDKDWYFDFSAYVAYMVEKYNLTESYPGEAEEFFRESLELETLQFNPATETIMYTYVNDGKPEVFVMTQEDEYNTYRPFIKQYTAPVPTYTVTANAEAGGTATGGGTFNKGATATVKATPNSGYHFTGWYKGNSKVSGDASYSFTVTENVTLTAKFEKDASSGDNGGNNGGSNQNANRCHWCGKTHDANFFQKIIGFFHNILAKIFGNKY